METSTMIRVVMKDSLEDVRTTDSRIVMVTIMEIARKGLITTVEIAVITTEVVVVMVVELVALAALALSQESDKQARACRSYHLKVKRKF